MKELWEYGLDRRTLNKLEMSGEISYKTPREINQIIHRDKWPYKLKQDYYHTRDIALASLVYLSSGRINEVLRVRSNQIIPDDEDPDFMIIQAFYVSKRKAGKMHPTPDIPLPLKGKLSPFTKQVLDYIELLGSDEKLFKFSRHRAWAIIRHITNNTNNDDPGWFCHWFRAQSLSYHVNLIRSTIAVARQRGIENPKTLMKYYRGDWKLFKDELKQ